MHEGDARGRVVAHAADLAHEGGIAERLDLHVGEMDVGGLALDVLAALSLSATFPAHLRIGLGAAKS